VVSKKISALIGSHSLDFSNHVQEYSLVALEARELVLLISSVRRWEWHLQQQAFTD